MKILIILVTRNIKVFMRDRMSVFFSFMSVLIIIMLYALFLRNMLLNSVTSASGNLKGISWLVDSWLMAGLIVVNSITVTLGILGLMVTDNTENKLRSFLVAPVKRSILVSGYLVSAWIIGTILTVFTFILGEIYIWINGGELLSFLQILKVLGLIILNVFSGTSIIFFFVTLIKSNGAFQTFSTILGTIIGFITGIYMPIGVLSANLQLFTKFVPATYGVALMRQAFMEKPLDNLFSGAPEKAVTSFEKFFGSQVYLGDYQFSPWLMCLILILSGFLFIGLSVLTVSRKKKD